MQLTDEYLDDLMVRMAHHSTAIEGNTLTQGETKSVLIDGYVPRPIELRELNEVLNYKQFMKALVQFLQEKRAIDLQFIQEVHRILCHDAIQTVPGKFKTQPNMVIGADFVPTLPYLVPMELENWRRDLEAQLDVAQKERDIVDVICRQHLRFEHIHPFPDGNGRVGRALMVYTCLQNELAPIVIPVQEKKRYINYLNNNDVAGLVDFCEELLQEEKQRMELFKSFAGIIPNLEMDKEDIKEERLRTKKLL